MKMEHYKDNCEKKTLYGKLFIALKKALGSDQAIYILTRAPNKLLGLLGVSFWNKSGPYSNLFFTFS